MGWIDWSIVLIYLTWIVYSGLRYRKQAKSLDEYLLAGRSMPWWAVGLSVMATQMSAITLIGTTGQGFEDGMRFVQFYLGLPLAMIILSRINRKTPKRVRGCSSVGRASALQAEGRRFNSAQLHQHSLYSVE